MGKNNDLLFDEYHLQEFATRIDDDHISINGVVFELIEHKMYTRQWLVKGMGYARSNQGETEVQEQD